MTESEIKITFAAAALSGLLAKDCYRDSLIAAAAWDLAEKMYEAGGDRVNEPREPSMGPR